MSEFMCINDRIEPLFNAAAATQVAFQQPAKDVGFQPAVGIAWRVAGFKALSLK